MSKKKQVEDPIEVDLAGVSQPSEVLPTGPAEVATPQPQKSFVCSVCGSRYRDSNVFKKHLSRVHSWPTDKSERVIPSREERDPDAESKTEPISD